MSEQRRHGAEERRAAFIVEPAPPAPPPDEQPAHEASSASAAAPALPEAIATTPLAAPLTTPRNGVGGRTGAGATLTLERALWLFVLAAATALRLLSLGATPLTQAEGGRALQSLAAAQLRTGSLSGWPGGIVDALTALAFKLFGANDATARLAPALAGVLFVASLWLLRPYFGRAATLIAAVLLTLSPVATLAARTTGGQSLGGAFAVAFAALLLRYIERPRPRLLSGAVALLAFGLGTDAVFLGLTLVFVAWLVLRGWYWRDTAVNEAWARARRYGDWLPSALPLALAGLLLTCSRFGLGFERLRPAAAAEWALAFTPLQGGAPWHYLLDALVGYELPLLALGAAGCWLLVRARAWRVRPVDGLLLGWLAGGVALDLAMAVRQPATLLLPLLPLCLLGGLVLSRLAQAFRDGCADLIDKLLAGGLLAALSFSLIAAGRSLTVKLIGQTPELWFGAILASVCLIGVIYRWEQDGAGTALYATLALALAAIVFDLHGAGALGFGQGDEFVTGQRTTAQGATLARLLVANGGGVSTITDEALGPLAWYLRDTVRSGGHGQARLIAAGAAPPQGFHLAGDPATVSRRWYPGSWRAARMVRWWVYREAWGDVRQVRVQLAVAN